MLTLYFSGTGNSAYIAKLFAAQMGGECLSIEEDADFSSLIQIADAVAFVYPVYASRLPRILKEFVAAHKAGLIGKKLVILCTQMMFSGDGARCFTDQLPKHSVEVVYAEHFILPNNVNNLWVFPQTGERRTRRLAERAKRQVARVCADITAGVVRRRGFNPLSRLAGGMQAVFYALLEKTVKRRVLISVECVGCGKCVERCPMKNLSLRDGKAVAGNNCTDCYRCINLCPQRAINLYFDGKVKWQYRGLNEK